MQKKDTPEIIPPPDIPVHPHTPVLPEIKPVPEKPEPIAPEPVVPFPPPEISPEKEKEL